MVVVRINRMYFDETRKYKRRVSEDLNVGDMVY